MLTIAIVHHEPNLLTALRMTFEAARYGVRTFSNTADAMELIENPPDLYILARRTRPLSGVEFFKLIRKRSNVPVLFLTANPEIIEQELADTNRKSDGYIELPFSQRQVLERARELLNG